MVECCFDVKVMVEPMERIKKDYGSVDPFSELGYHEGQSGNENTRFLR